MSASSTGPSSMPKSAILASAGRQAWYTSRGENIPAIVIGIGGGSASGKSRVSQDIIKLLDPQSACILALDSFYKELSTEESTLAFQNLYDFDSPDSFDIELFVQTLSELKAMRAVQIPKYSFTRHNRLPGQSTYLYGASVIIVEGIFVLHDQRIRDLIDVCVYVQLDPDLMLARRIRRDIVERGRDAVGVLDQYLRYVKPSFDNYIARTARYADIVVQGQHNEISISLVVSHIRQSLSRRMSSMRSNLSRTVAVEGAPDPPVIVLDSSPQLRGIVTALRDESTSLEDFRFFSDRLSTLLIERALNLLPTRPKQVKVGGTEVTYNGQESAVSPAHLVGVSILRSGCALESGLRQVCKDIAIGSLLIQSDKKTGEPALLLVSLPSQLKQGVEGAKETYVMLIDSQIGSGAAGYMAIKVLLDHGVLEERIIFICLLCSRIGGIQAISKAFPRIRIVSGAIDDELEERWSDGIGKQDAQKVFTILPGLGSFGDRYYSPIK